MRDNNLKRWLTTNNYLLDKTKDDDCSIKATHFFLDGGKAAIPFDKLDEFHKVYTECLNKNVQLFVIECRTDIFRFFADLDFASPELLSDEYILEVIGTINASVSFLYAKDLNVIVCNTNTKKITKNGSNLIKQGYHLFWPDIYIDMQTAIKIRQYLLEKIKLVYGERASVNPWADVLDEVVYKSNGIRMNGSYKMNIFTTDNKRRFQVENRKYTLLTVLNGDKNIVHTEIQRLTNMDELIKNTTIRTNLTNITPLVNTEPLTISEKLSIEAEQDNDEGTNSSSNTMAQDSDDFYLKRINKNNRKYTEILKFFEIHVADKNYKVGQIKGILHIEKTDSYVLKTTSGYCQNIERSHNSCGIYFILNKNGLCQKCYCKCNTLDGRKDGYCKDYSSPLIPCSLQIIRALNWEVKKKNPKKIIDSNEIPFSLGKKNISYQSKVGLIRMNIYNGIIN